MNLNALPTAIDRAAEARRPQAAGDWYNDKGLLMCGKCNAPLEYIITGERIRPFPEDASPERLEAMRKARDSIVGTKHRIVCKCATNERELYKRDREREALENRYADCYGNTSHLSKTTWAADDGRDRYATVTLRRYASKFREMRERCINLLLHGEQGSGKTYFGLSLINNIMVLGYRAQYTTAYNIITRTSPYISAQLVINAMLDADVILCDDANENVLEGRAKEVFEALVASAKARGIPLIVNTKLEGNKLGDLKRIFNGSQIEIGRESKDGEA